MTQQLPETLAKRLKEMRCSFCGKASHEVAKFVAGPRSGICDECLAVVAEILGFQLVPRAKVET